MSVPPSNSIPTKQNLLMRFFLDELLGCNTQTIGIIWQKGGILGPRRHFHHLKDRKLERDIFLGP